MLTTITVPGNVHDSVSFFEAYNVYENIKMKLRTSVLDAGQTPAICNNNRQQSKNYSALSRPMTKKDILRNTNLSMKQENIYICPMGCVLKHGTTSRDAIKVIKLKTV